MNSNDYNHSQTHTHTHEANYYENNYIHRYKFIKTNFKMGNTENIWC
jgi:hypothetical protein